MPLDRFLIAPEEVGLETDLRPWLLPDTGYEQLNNAYIYRGRIRKRFGSQYMVPSTTPSPGYEQLASRLRVFLGVGPGTYNIPDSSVLNPLQIGQIFSVGDNIFTIFQVGAGVLTLSTNAGMSATIDTTVTPNTVTFVGVPASNAYWYPSLPVMGLIVWQTQTINNEPTIAFDTRYAYQYASTGWERLNLEATVGDALWSGSDSQFFWGYTYQGRNLFENFLFVTNFNENETHFMRYLDGSFTWNSFAPVYATPNGTVAAATGKVIAARIIIGFHNHLVLLNTWEQDSVLGKNNFKNRARYAAIGTPLDTDSAAPPAPATAYFPWVDNKNSPYFRGGGYVDNLQTQEQIISAEFIKDRLIVYYERSTWELAYTGNEQIPFIWQQINTEFGAQSTFSKVPFDTHVLAIAQNGITQCTGANVNRIDEKIPQEVFKFRQMTNQGPSRVQGVRDYDKEMVYWTIPYAPVDIEFSQTYPNQILTYNYRTGSWAYNTDSFTAFGYWVISTGATWGNTFTQWQFMTALWSDGSLQQNARKILAGNQEGYVLVINPDLTRNAGALEITNMIAGFDFVTIQSINHNLTDNDILTGQDEYVLLENIQGTGNWTLLNGVITPIIQIIDKDHFTVAAFPGIVGAYTGAGTVARVSNINILSKQWNPYNKSGQNVFIQKINFLVDRTESSEVQVDYYPSTSKYSMLTNSVPGQLMSSGVLETRPYDPVFYPSEQLQDRLWHVQYLAVDGTAIQIRITWNDNQIINPNISLADFQMHAVILETMPTSVRIGG